jgi:hypothetical protein
MKCLFLSIIATVFFASMGSAQEISKNAIGLRLGSNDGFGAEISYQRGLSQNNRAEFNLGFRNATNYSAFKLTGLYQWVWNIEDGFNWYAGAGAGIGSYSFNNYKGSDKSSGAFFTAAGNIGIEYLFDIPLQLSLDFRPEIYFGDKYRADNFGSDIALAVRYRFN